MPHFTPVSPEEFERLQDQQAMHADANEHAIADLMDVLDKDQLLALTDLLLRSGGDLHVATHFTGIIRAMMRFKFNACRCGIFHEQAEDLLKGHEPVAETVDEHRLLEESEMVTDHAFEAGPGSTGAACTAMVTDKDGFGKDCGQSPGKHIFTTSLDPSEQDSYANSAIAIMEKYNVTPDVSFPKVQCMGCGLMYPNLRDRMLKGPDDCHGCFMKASQG